MDKQSITILFVCTGNTCRSSMAAALMERKIRQRGLNDIVVKVISAGTGTVDGLPASAEAIEVMKQRDIDLTGHKSAQLTPEMIDAADLILVMTARHKQQVLSLNPNAVDKVFMLNEFILSSSEKEMLEAQYQEALQTLRKKTEAFYHQHGAELDNLNSEKTQLENRIHEINEKIAQLEQQIRLETAPEHQIIRDIQQKVRSMDISDPFGGSEDIYEMCARELEDGIDQALEKIFDQTGNCQSM